MVFLYIRVGHKGFPYIREDLKDCSLYIRVGITEFVDFRGLSKYMKYNENHSLYKSRS